MLVFTCFEIEDYFEYNRVHGVAVVDFDCDGDLDFVVGNSCMCCEGEYGADCYEKE